MEAMDKQSKVKEQTRLRQKNFYEKHKSSILQKRKDKRQVKKEVVIEEVIIREKIDLDKVINRIENVLQNGNEITMKTHIQRMKIVHRLTDFNDLETDLFDYGKMIDCIEIGTYGKLNKVYKNNSKKNLMETLLYCLDNIDIQINIDIRTQYQDYYDKLKIISNDQLNVSKTSQLNAIMHFEDYRNKILERYGKDSKEFLLVKLYETACCRDDFNLFIINDLEETKRDKTKNYLIMTNEYYVICIQNYKTSKEKEAVYIKIPDDVKELINNYVNKHDITDRLFPNSKSGLNSQFISKMNRKIGIIGGINWIRHCVISSEIGNLDITPEERLALAKKCFHSPITSLSYVRSLIEND